MSKSTKNTLYGDAFFINHIPKEDAIEAKKDRQMSLKTPKITPKSYTKMRGKGHGKNEQTKV